MPVLTLTSDFGQKDPDLAILKAQIIQAIPDITIIDISHDITPFDLEEALYILKNTLFEFPKGSIHFIAVNSETFSNNRPVLVKDKKYTFVGNDTGIIPALLEDENYQAFYLDAVPYDSFMKVHLEALVHISEEAFPTLMTNPANDLKKIKLPEPIIGYEGNSIKYIRPKVIYVDHFGNAIFNLKKIDFEKWRQGRKTIIKTVNSPIQYLSQGYNDIKTSSFGSKSGGYGARFNSFGYFEIFVNGSNQKSGGANTLLGLSKNETIHILFE